MKKTDWKQRAKLMSAAFAVSTGILFTGLGVHAEESAPLEQARQEGVLLGDKTAGVLRSINQYRANSMNHELLVSKNSVSMVAYAQENPWPSRLMSREGNIDIMESPQEGAARVGLLRENDLAEITGQQGGWYQIASGNLKGFISSERVLTGDDARAKALSFYGDRQDYSLGMTTEEEQEQQRQEQEQVKSQRQKAQREAEAKREAARQKREAAKRQAQEDAANKASMSTQAENKTHPQNSGSEDELALMAAVLQLEAGNSYQGMVAVGGVIMNRVESGRYPNSIRGVVSQRGQFVTYARARSKVQQGRVSASAMAAAREALAGADPTGGKLSFRAAYSTRHKGINIGGNVFF